MSAGERRPPGWYDDVTDGPLLRYWDGSGWTPHTSSRDADGPQPAGTAPATADVTPALEATHRIESILGAAAADSSDAVSPPDHTTVPTPAGGPRSAPVMMPTALAPSPRVWFVAAAGAITAAASLVVAFAALSVALGR